jgi:SAM-dependent methyltransferase
LATEKDLFWDNAYKNRGQIWGDGPNELARVAVKYLAKLDVPLSILDIGCGYGRDAMYLANHLDASILGIDPSPVAIDMAKETCDAADVAFACCGFAEIDGTYDAVYVSNLYHLLRSDERQRLRGAIAERLKPGGLLFLCSLSPSDPHYYGKGTPILEDPNSFEDKMFLHFGTRDELTRDFEFLRIAELYEHAYEEHHPGSGDVHHHVTWILIGKAGEKENAQTR